jgi:predicted DNA-binding protein (MmcQ/YjbR family)
MNVEEIQKTCNELPGVTEDIKWGHDLCFSVNKKMFLVVGVDESPVNASFKVTDEQFEEMSARPGFKPAPYMARHKWVFISDTKLMNKKEWKFFIKQAYEIVGKKKR